MKNTWYELEYEANEMGKACCGPTVLYTSEQGLSALVAELTRVSTEGSGRHALQIEDMDDEYYLPFSHVEVTDKPQIKEDDKMNWKPIYWLSGIFLTLLFLALYGVVRLVMDIVI